MSEEPVIQQLAEDTHRIDWLSERFGLLTRGDFTALTIPTRGQVMYRRFCPTIQTQGKERHE
jgi:hypothetical protein